MNASISIEQGQRIAVARQAEGVPCLPRPVSYSNDSSKALLESGADGILVQMVDTPAKFNGIIVRNEADHLEVVRRVTKGGAKPGAYVNHAGDSVWRPIAEFDEPFVDDLLAPSSWERSRYGTCLW
jgi:hypothetical protein